ncbi:Tripeptidyl-peptidase SED2 [Lachnellula arida]|uniref:tripeptidyl-peptidase II n=1 Tax=Lachnellula arida TaxID=1316785 RepID=A0A8T9BJN5_9HELO|nr:Tripeptidyl-peptidase SED2 [Lachnellula arida]
MMHHRIFAPIVLATLCFASCAHSTPYSIKERHPVPDGWSLLRRAPRQGEIKLQIGLKQGQFHELERHLNEDPSHTRYGQYLTADEVSDLIRPSEDTLLLVQEWIEQSGIGAEKIVFSPASDWITMDLSVSDAEMLLHTEYSEFWHAESKTLAVRAPEWSLPGHLHSHIESVQPTSSFFHAAGLAAKIEFPRSLYVDRDEGAGNPDIKDLNQLAESLSGELSQSIDLDNLPSDLNARQACNTSAVTPLCIRALYGTLTYEAQASDQNAMAIVNYAGEFNNRSDIDLFLKAFRPDAARAGVAFNFQEDNIAGAVNQQSPATASQLAEKMGREGNLDAQALLGLAFPTALISYSVGGEAPAFDPDKYTPTNTNEPFLTWLHHVLAQKELPQVISTSYGDIEQTVPYSYAKRVCEGFAQLGARGVTVIFGAGDSGVGKDGYCRSNNGSENYEFLTSFPASCPYGTSVGATRNIEPEEVAHNERNGFVSGGGFSRYFPRPAYQDVHGVVESYLSRLGADTYTSLYNRQGRAYPDVAAQGYRRVIVWNGEKFLVDGTSASAPTFAAVVALVNDALIAERKPVLGFLNPWLYQKGFEAFTDVTKGSNKGCGTDGYFAAAGWDPASGFGTPWFPRLKELALERKFRSQRPWYWLFK